MTVTTTAVADALTHVARKVAEPGDRAALNRAIVVLRNLTQPSAGDHHTLTCDCGNHRDHHERAPRDAAVFVCQCTTALPGDPSNAGACKTCGYPVVATMAPELQHRMAVKWPGVARQRVVTPDGTVLLSEHLGART